MAGGGASSGSSSSGSNTTSSKTKSQVARSKAPDPPTHRRSNKPPLHPDTASKKHPVKGPINHEHKEDVQEPLDRTVTPQEVMKKQLMSVAQRMNQNREHRKHHGGLVPRNYSPLTPIMQKYKQEEDGMKPDRQGRAQRHTELHDKRGVVPKAVKFAPTVTEFPSTRFDEESSSNSNSRTVAKSSGHKFAPGHLSGGGNSGGGGGGVGVGGSHSSPGHSPGHSVLGHNSLGQYNDRTIPDGESGHTKSDATARKLSAEK